MLAAEAALTAAQLWYFHRTLRRCVDELLRSLDKLGRRLDEAFAQIMDRRSGHADG